MITIYIEQITRSCYSFKTPDPRPYFLYERSARAARRRFVRMFGLRGAVNIRFEKIGK
jgi:hypothetical protein